VNLQTHVSVVPTEPDRSASGHRVLVAEDEALIRLDLVEMLAEESYIVTGEAADGEQTIEQADTLHPDLVIMDVKTPKMDGIDAVSIIAKRSITAVCSRRLLVRRHAWRSAPLSARRPFWKPRRLGEPAAAVATPRAGGQPVVVHR
jgi:response regulator NasT